MRGKNFSHAWFTCHDLGTNTVEVRQLYHPDWWEWKGEYFKIMRKRMIVTSNN